MVDAVPTLSTAELLLRVAVAALLGGAIGFEREFSDQPAGFRTHILVSLGAALFTLAGAYGVEAFFPTGEATIQFDPTRVAAQVVTGIGFLGAGAILRQGLNVRGLTTAAALWVTAAIGVAVGLGYWVGAAAVTGLTVLSLYGLKKVERIFVRRYTRGRYEFAVDMDQGFSLSDLAAAVEAHRGRVDSMRIAGERDEGIHRLVAAIVLPTSISPEILAAEIARLDGTQDVDWS